MNLDIRTPIGLFFAIVGVILTIYGMFSDPKIYEASLGHNVNLGWGLVLLVFGIVMLALAWHAGRSPVPPASKDENARPASH